MTRRNLLATAAVVAVSTAATVSGALVQLESEELMPALLAAHNKERAQKKLPQLSIDLKLTAAARVHALDMAKNHFMAHEGSDESLPAARVKKQGYKYRSLGENVARGMNSVESVMKVWMESKQHRDNILGSYSDIGMAVARDDADKPYWCVEFGTPWPTLEPELAAGDLIAAVNKERAAAGLKPLTSKAKLADVAARLAQDMADADTLEEVTKDRGAKLSAGLKRVGYRYRSLAETAGSGQPAPSDVIATWLASSENRKVLLGDYTEAGASCAKAISGKPYWSLILARPLPRSRR
jgi:uncharacterized protein YkwD